MTPSPPRIAITGPTPYWNEVAAHLARRAGLQTSLLPTPNLAGLFKTPFSTAWRSADLLYRVGGVANKPLDLLLAADRRPLLWHWTGTDLVAWTAGRAARSWRRPLNQYFHRRRIARHLADSPELARELHAIGIDAPVVRLLPPRIHAQPIPLPETVAVLAYWTDDSAAFYRADWILQLARDFPDLPFRILAATGRNLRPLWPDPIPPNVHFLGRQNDPEPTYRLSSVLVRLPKHDSISAMALEMLARGRYVIYNMPLQPCRHANTLDQARHQLHQLRHHLDQLRHQRQPDHAASAWVARHFSLDQQAATLAHLTSQTLKK